MHEKWHGAYEEALHVPFIVSSPLLPGGARELEIPTNHADLIPTLLGLAGIDHDDALAELRTDHTLTPARWSDATSRMRSAPPSPRPRSSPSSSRPTTRSARAAPTAPARSSASHGASRMSTDRRAAQPHRDGDRRGRRRRRAAPRSSSPATTTTSSSGRSPASATSACAAATPITVTEPEPDEFELYDLTVDPLEERNLAHPSHADERSCALQQTMLRLLGEQLAAKRLTPSTGEVPGYRPPAVDLSIGSATPDIKSS